LKAWSDKEQVARILLNKIGEYVSSNILGLIRTHYTDPIKIKIINLSGD
jgi:uncharacterized protein YukJ